MTENTSFIWYGEISLCSYATLYFLKFYYFLSGTFFKTNFHEIGTLYVNRPFCLLLLWHCSLGYAAC